MQAFLIALALCLCAAAPVSAQVKVVRGEGSAAVQGLFASGPSAQERASAMQAAKLGAWRSYLAMPGNNETVDEIRANEKAFLDRIDDLLVDVVIVDESFSKDTKRYNVRIKAAVAETVVNSMIRANSRTAVRQQTTDPAAAAGPAGGPAAGAAIVILGMSREADVIKSFMEKETRMTDVGVDRSESETNTEAVKGGRGGRTAAVSSTASASVQARATTGGSREQKRDKVTYKVGNTSILNSKLPRILLQSGVKSTPYSFLMRPCQLPNPDSFSRQYAASEQGELPADVMADIQEKLFACRRAKYWVFASMDTGGYRKDPNTGLNLVTVTVNVQLMEVETGAQVASASKDVSGRSGDQSDAMRVATDNAVQAVGDIISAQISALGK